MATKDDIRKVISYLQSARLNYAPREPAEVQAMCGAWLDVLGDLDANRLHDAARVYISRLDVHGDGTQGKDWPTPATMRGMARGACGETEGPQGCGDCRGTGAVRGVWVSRKAHGGDLCEYSRQLYCGCARGDWMRDRHRSSTNPMGPVKMQHVGDFCAGLQREPLIALDDARRGIIWGRVEHPHDAETMPAEVRAALRTQGERKGTQAPREALVVEEVREERGPMAGRVLRPDRGWEALAEVNL